MHPTEEQTYRRMIDEKLALILMQTTKTNGRVNFLFKMLYMGMGAVGILTSIVIPLLAAYIQR